jgi:nucleoid DNA-binding protein
MTRKEKIIRDLAREEKLDPRVVKLVVDSVIKFTRDRITDPTDRRAVMIPHFGKFAPKPKLIRGDVNKFNHGKQ